MEVMTVKKNTNSYFNKKNITAIYGEASDLSIIINNYAKLEYNSKHKVKTFIKKDTRFFKDLNLTEEILNKKIAELSFCEFKFILLIKAILLKPEIIILDNFEKGFTPKSYNLIWHFIKKITLSENIKFLIISKDLKFINKITKKIIIINNKIIKYQGDIITAIKQNLIETPDIIDFIELANEKKAKLTYTLDSKDLLKDIYRRVS